MPEHGKDCSVSGSRMPDAIFHTAGMIDQLGSQLGDVACADEQRNHVENIVLVSKRTGSCGLLWRAGSAEQPSECLDEPIKLRPV